MEYVNIFNMFFIRYSYKLQLVCYDKKFFFVFSLYNLLRNTIFQNQIAIVCQYSYDI